MKEERHQLLSTHSSSASTTASYSKFRTEALSCQVCGKLFDGRNKKQNLKHHMMTHTGERRYVCPFCHHRTAHKWHLKTHVSRRHPANVYDECVAWLGFKLSHQNHGSNETVMNSTHPDYNCILPLPPVQQVVQPTEQPQRLS